MDGFSISECDKRFFILNDFEQVLLRKKTGWRQKALGK